MSDTGVNVKQVALIIFFLETACLAFPIKVKYPKQRTPPSRVSGNLQHRHDPFFRLFFKYVTLSPSRTNRDLSAI